MMTSLKSFDIILGIVWVVMDIAGNIFFLEDFNITNPTGSTRVDGQDSQN